MLKVFKKIVDRFHLVNDQNEKEILVYLDILFERMRGGSFAAQIQNMFQILVYKNKKNKKKLKFLHLSKLKHHYLQKLNKKFELNDLNDFKMLITKEKYMNNKQFQYMLLRFQISEDKYTKNKKGLSNMVGDTSFMIYCLKFHSIIISDWLN